MLDHFRCVWHLCLQYANLKSRFYWKYSAFVHQTTSRCILSPTLPCTVRTIPTASAAASSTQAELVPSPENNKSICGQLLQNAFYLNLFPPIWMPGLLSSCSSYECIFREQTFLVIYNELCDKLPLHIRSFNSLAKLQQGMNKFLAVLKAIGKNAIHAVVDASYEMGPHFWSSWSTSSMHLTTYSG